MPDIQYAFLNSVAQKLVENYLTTTQISTVTCVCFYYSVVK